MGFTVSSKEYVDYMVIAGKVIYDNGDYITALDAKTGDGDHWVNLNSGFQKITEIQDSLKELPLSDMLKKIGMTLMSSIGGSSGVLYGGGYIAASKALADVEELDQNSLLLLLETLLKSIMDRGKAQPGWKTMIDSLYEGVEAYKSAVAAGLGENEIMAALKKGAEEGRDKTKEMEAVKGRASYQTNKGVGELDPGAVTMCIQLVCLAEYITEKKLA